MPEADVAADVARCLAGPDPEFGLADMADRNYPRLEARPPPRRKLQGCQQTGRRHRHDQHDMGDGARPLRRHLLHVTQDSQATSSSVTSAGVTPAVSSR